MHFSKSILLIVSFFSLLLSTNVNAIRIFHVYVPTPSPSATPAPAPHAIVVIDPLLVELCKDAENSTLCVETILPYFQGPIDPVKALKIEIEATKNQTEKVVDIIANLLGDPNTPKELAAPLDVCKENYDSLMDNIMETVKALSEYDLGTAETMLSAVISDQQTCEDTFKETPGVDFPFSDDSLVVFQLAANCLAILQFLTR